MLRQKIRVACETVMRQTCRFFGLSRALFYIWKKHHEKNDLAGLRDLKQSSHHIRYRIPPEIICLILRIREERRHGVVRISLYLQRHYHAYVSPTTILKIFHPHHVGPVSLRSTGRAQNQRTLPSRFPVALCSWM